ncbi:pre-peptidase C-terminal domain-containing protein [Kovacikia minuta CCNUW1]|uniref:pre-peptidase C-terminal domain-containing protein n=1 Tax=Kovacikia minuta TaxID=2931930 RepID=UPI001CC99977|nr:pre-peptidase C-terminal domain-containing protein [Kovacikia minuta]UBF25607.1 pre-peptidase C-terminal domain-containing protein [Kovacikia minuta CCNUW1]
MFSKPQQPSILLSSTSASGTVSATSIAPLSTAATSTTLTDPIQPNLGWMQSSSAQAATISPASPGDNIPEAYDLGTLQGRRDFSGFVGNSDPQDFYRFQLGTTSSLSLNLTGLSADADLFLVRDFNNNGLVESNEIVAQSIATGITSESINLNGLGAGTYFAVAVQYSGNTNYNLSLTSDAAGNSLSSARNLGAISGNGSIADFVGNSDLDDFYQFQLNSFSDLSLNLSGLNADADLYLIQDANYNGLVDSGEILNYSVVSGTSSESIWMAGLAPGNYYIGVAQYQGNTNYQLGISASATEPGNSLSAAANFGIVSGQVSTSGFVGASDLQDIYRFQLNATSHLDLNLTGLSADADLYLIQDINNNGAIDANDVISSSTAIGNSSESISIAGLSAGSYFVGVVRYSGFTNYNLTLTADAAGDTLYTARDIGSLSGTRDFSDFVSNADYNDYYQFSLNNTSNFSANLSGLSADADLYLIRDFNGNGNIDAGEILAASAVSGSVSESITYNGLASGNYTVLVYQYSGNTNYNLQLAATSVSALQPANAPLDGLQLVEGTLYADTFTYNPNYDYTVFSGNGNVEFGEGWQDQIDLSDFLSSSVSLNLAGINGDGVLFNAGDGTQVFDVATLSNGDQILFEGIDSIQFADGALNLSVTPDDPLFSQQWNLGMMGVQNAWRFTTGSSDVMIGIEDTGLGIDYAGDIHPDLPTTLMIPDNIADDFNDSSSHGTGVEGIISAVSDNGFGLSGINWNSPVAQVDVISGDDVDDFSLVEATQALIEQASSEGQRLVINLSLTYTPDAAFEQLVASHQDDVLFVIATGNGNDSSLDYPAYLASDYDNVIAVGASWGTSDVNGNPTIAGTRISYPGWWGSNYGYGLTLMGPSEVITTEATSSYYSGAEFGINSQFNGTSAATPNVTGVASLVWSANPDLTATQVQQILSETAYDLGAPGYDLVYGNGFVNADSAVRRAIAIGQGAA